MQKATDFFANAFHNAVNACRRAWRKIKGKRNRAKGAANAQRGEMFVPRGRERSFVLSVVFLSMRFILLSLVLVGCVGMGLVLGVAKAYIDTTPDVDLFQLTKSDRTSYIYDGNGNLITTFAGMEYRDWADISEIPDMLINAVVSIEDVRFYKHDGVDFKRLASAVINTLRNSDTHGGSTITQQLVKTRLLSNEQSYKRKIQEAYLALEVETKLEKDKIIEAYLNQNYLGGSNYGVKAAAKDYFGKALSQLTIRECAMLAGLFQKPYETNPRSNMYLRFYEDGTSKMDITNNRTDTVINRMYLSGFITKEQCTAALADTVSIVEVSAQRQLYDMPYFVEYAVYDVITHLLRSRGMLDTLSNRVALENELRTGGYRIYLTVDPDIQHTVEETLATWTKYPPLANPKANVKITTDSDGTTLETSQPQAAVVIIDQSTGELKAVVGGRDAPERRKQWNRAYQSAMPVGSSIKPLSVYGPALELGMSPASVVYNLPAPIVGWNTEKGFPAIGNEKYIGPITMRRGVISSLNVAAARTLLENVSIETATRYLVSLGVDASRINEDGSGLALGTSAITPIEMAAAFATIANEGVYITPVSFSRVVDSTGKVILSADQSQETRRVFKSTTAYMLVDLLTDAVQRGTGTSAKIKGMTVAGKTGTNSDYSSVYFTGITPYYTAAVWVGHDDYAQKLKSGSSGGSYAAPLWQEFMSKILAGYTDKPILDASPAELGLVKCTVCTVSGKLATEACLLDPAEHKPVTDWFASESAPLDFCDMHVTSAICTVSGQPASAYCPVNARETSTIVLISSLSPYSAFDPVMLKTYIPNAVFTEIPIDQYGVSSYEPGAVCSVHAPGYSNPFALSGAISEANALIRTVETYLNAVQTISSTDRNTLATGINSLRLRVNGRDLDGILQYTSTLEYNYAVISAANPPVANPPNIPNYEDPDEPEYPDDRQAM